jgi:hypothetical protein
MTRTVGLIMMAATLAGALGGCGPGPGGDNPPQLWLALAGDELHAKLVTAQPPHY